MEYRILQPLKFHSGALLGLTEDQARVRKTVIESLGARLYRVITEVQFKAGEIISYEGALPKSMAFSAEPVELEVIAEIVATETAARKAGRPKKVS